MAGSSIAIGAAGVFGAISDFGLQDLVTGGTKGLAYAALAAGFVLIYRSTGVLNFAHAEVGAVGLALFILLVVRWDVNWWLAFFISVVVGALIGAVVELTIVRRLFNAPRLVLLIATIGVAQLLQAVRIELPKVQAAGNFPLPFDRRFGDPREDAFVLFPRDYIVIVVVPILIAALAYFLNRTRFGLAVRATASNPDTARVFGTSPRITSTIVWAVAGALAVATAIVLAPGDGGTAAQAASTALAAPLLLRAITVGLIARMRSIPMVLVGGIAVGVGEQFVARVQSRSVVDLYLFVLVLGVVLMATARGGGEEGSWSLTPHLEPIPHRLRSIWWVRHLNTIGFVALFGALAGLGLLLDSPSRLFLWTGILIVAIVGLSLSLLTGWAGQLSLGHFAFVGLGAMTMVVLTQGKVLPIIGRGFTLEWGVALLFAIAVGAITALLIGLPALRVRGLFLAVATLAFAVAGTEWFFREPIFRSSGLSTAPVVKPVIGPIDFVDRRAYYFLCLGSLVLIAAFVARVRRSGIGRSLIAVRENEQAASASTISPNRMKLIAFALSGAIASFAGALFITLQSRIDPVIEFSPEESIRMVAIAIIGGLGSIAGPVLGSLWVEGIPALWGNSPPDLVVLLTSSIGLLLLLMYLPGGLQQLVYQGRSAILDWAESRLPAEPGSAPATRTVAAVPTRNPWTDVATPDVPALATTGVSVTFGGNQAVDNVDFHVMPQELVGLIGTNGAGKSTLLNAVSGFVPSTGGIQVLGTEISGMAAHERHRLGLGRGFQSARLYPDLNVQETLMVALEARGRSAFLPSVLGLPSARRADRVKLSEAHDIMDFLGLGPFAESYIGSLSTGTRRIVELGSLLAADARVLLLDEPTGGVAQKETEAFGPLIRRIKKELNASVVVIEHDMPLVMSISDRVYCLESGAVIAEGTPDQVRRDPLVIASYLGTDERAINRSDQSAPVV